MFMDTCSSSYLYEIYFSLAYMSEDNCKRLEVSHRVTKVCSIAWYEIQGKNVTLNAEPRKRYTENIYFQRQSVDYKI